MSIERWFYRVSMRIRALFRGRAMDVDLDEELGYHLERLIEANIARGLSPDEARRQALVAIGGVEQRKEECRDTRRVAVVHDAFRDLRYAFRTLRHSPAFTTAAILTLTLGIGATVAMFTVVNGVLLRPMPFPRPEQLFLASLAPRGPFMSQPALADRHYLAFREHDSGFQHLAAFSSYKGNLTGAGDPTVIPVGSVTTDFFAALQVPPVAGRTFVDDDGQDGRERIVVLGDQLWRSRFGANPAIVGDSITIDNLPHVVVGVMPAGFDFPNRAQAWTPKVIRLDGGNSLMFPVLGRLKPDVTLTQARARFDAFMRLPENASGDVSEWLVGLLPLKDLLVRDIRRPLQIFAGAVMFVLLIACANVASLLLARASNRQREIAVRAALGASRARLIRQLLTESTLLALAGGACGTLAAHWAIPALLSLAPSGRIPRAEMIVIDPWVLAFAVGVSLMTGIVFGLAPAVRLTRRQFVGSLQPGARRFQAGQERLRAALVIGEIALALVLLTGAGLMLRSFNRLLAVDPGFRPGNVVTMTASLPSSKYSTAEKLQMFHQDTLARLSNLPEVVGVGAVNWRPLGDIVMSGDFQVEGRRSSPDAVDKTAVSPGYFRAMGIPLVRGRDFTEEDNAGSAGVAIVSRSVARFISRSEDVLGKRVTMQTNPSPRDWLTVVGVVEDVKQWGPAQAAHPAIYQPYLQVRRPFFLRQMTFAVRAAADPARVAPAMRAAVRAVDKDQPVSIALMTDVLKQATSERAFQTRLLAVFALLALILALVGTYGVLAYSVALRTHEIGVRMALGAHGRDVLWMMIRRTLALAVLGIAAGIAGALGATRLLARLLFEIAPNDPATFAAAAVALLIAALSAGVVPARRATRVDPLVALRHE